MIDHLPVGAHIGLRQGATTRILEVEAEWDSTNARYQVININTGILSESASGTATELLLTAGTAGGGTGAAGEQFNRAVDRRYRHRDGEHLGGGGHGCRACPPRGGYCSMAAP